MWTTKSTNFTNLLLHYTLNYSYSDFAAKCELNRVIIRIFVLNLGPSSLGAFELVPVQQGDVLAHHVNNEGPYLAFYGIFVVQSVQALGETRRKSMNEKGDGFDFRLRPLLKRVLQPTNHH
jgi:hypothetical protein